MLQFPFIWKQFLMSSLFVIGHSGDDIIQIILWVYAIVAYCFFEKKLAIDVNFINDGQLTIF